MMHLRTIFERKRILERVVERLIDIGDDEDDGWFVDRVVSRARTRGAHDDDDDDDDDDDARRRVATTSTKSQSSGTISVTVREPWKWEGVKGLGRVRT